jgi:hypothetical protein
LLIQRAAVTGADRIDKDQVSLIQPGLLVVDQMIGRRRHGAISIHGDTSRADAPHVQPNRCRTRPTIE